MASRSNDDLGMKLNIVMLGKGGSGKSRTGNSILGDKSAFVFGEPTENCNAIKRERFSKYINLIDTPADATLHPEKLRSISQIIEQNKTCDHSSVCLFCVQICRFSHEDLQTFAKYTEYFDESLFQFSIVVFTNGDKWENDMYDKDIKDPNFKYFIEKLSDPVKCLVHRCGERYVRFNNRSQGEENDVQVKKLLTLVEKMLQSNSEHGFYFKIADMFKNEFNIKKPTSLDMSEKSQALSPTQDPASIYLVITIDGTITPRTT
ncbi:Hypothetical predicted protein [Mytilus galloprovincialis]|uniref:AIG1-type G domain-containing protein n=1 Tax=Mytilus galloprovincialis TaxID=29158 RepID=A0A8B6GX91_MYTGA|nr:Hypothetical predicted protein [Mytilus galloprovincialis]